MVAWTYINRSLFNFVTFRPLCKNTSLVFHSQNTVKLTVLGFVRFLASVNQLLKWLYVVLLKSNTVIINLQYKLTSIQESHCNLSQTMWIHLGFMYLFTVFNRNFEIVFPT